MVLHRISTLSLAALLAFVPTLVACGDDVVAGDEVGSTTNASGTDESESDTAVDTTTSTTESDTASFIGTDGPTTDADTTTTGGLGNLGDQCQTEADCAEDLFCNGVPGFGGICSECASDSDCPDGGNCTFTGAWFGCGDGSQGQMCESDASCGDGLYCAEVIDLAGLFNGNFCSECSEDAHCPDGQLCAPVVDFMNLMNIAGQRECIDPGTAPQDSLCDANGSGDEQCEGVCTVATFMGLIEVGICGECESDADCMGNSTCTPAELGLGGLSGSVCG